MGKKVLLICLIILNLMVLVGQIWPEGVPPFAREVNVAFLSFSFIYFLLQLVKKRKQ